MNKKNILFIGVGLLLVVVVVIVFMNQGNGLSKQQPQTLSVRLAWLPGATFAGDYVAIEKGFWKDSGLQVTLNPGGFENDAIKLVAAGADTIGITSGPQLLQARASGVPIVAIAAVIPRSPIGWISKQSSGITKPQDFVGKKIGAQFGTHTEITFEALCAKLGINLKSVNRIPVKFDPRPFIAGEVDVLPVYIIDQPIDLERQGQKLNIIDPGDYGVSLAFGNVYFTTEDTIRKHPEMIRAFLTGAKRGWLWAAEHQQDAADAIRKAASDAAKDVLVAKIDATIRFVTKGRDKYQGLYPMKLTDWQQTEETMRRFGELKGSVDLNTVFTNGLLPE